MNELTNGFTISIEGTTKSWHSLDDWGLAIGNNDYIGEPVQETTYIQVPGRDGLIDVSETVAGRPIFKKRSISIVVGALHNRMDWDSVMSGIRNKIHGRVCHIIFDNDITYYWRGRVSVNSFDRSRRLGTFKIEMPNADPYKYSISSSAEPWLWDPFNFETDVITYIGAITVTGSETVTLPSGNMLVSPEFVVSDIVGSLIVECNGRTYTLVQGTNNIPSILVGGDNEVELEFTGNGKVQIVYRSGSL